MDNQPQASVHKSTMWPWSRRHHHHPPGAHRSRRDPRNYVCVCQWPSVSSQPITQPCVCLRESPPNGRISSSWRSCSVSVEAFSFHSNDSAHLPGWHSGIPSWKLEASNWDDSAEQKWVRVVTIEVFFVGRKCWLWVLCMNVQWETSKEHHPQLGIFKECSSPREGQSSKSMWAFIKTFY